MTLEQIGVIAGIISTTLTGVYFLYKNFNAKQVKFRRELSGQWSNQGNIPQSKLETHSIELILNVGIDNGEITGTILPRNLKEDSIVPIYSVNGKLGFRFGTITISHVQNDKVIIYDKAQIKLRRKLIHWKLQKDSLDFFPIKTIFHKQ